MANSLLIKAAAPLIFAFAMCSSKAKPKEHTVATTGKFAVVELFTSEGCSSCPAADEAVAKAAKEYGDNVLVLAYHVDYWDRLGWKDPFSDAAYSQRQKSYASVMNLESIYTPQVIVNGLVQFVGSNDAALHRSIDQALKQKATSEFEIHAKSTSANEVSIDYAAGILADHTINIALVQSYAETQVKRGENGGRKLPHINIVRELKTFDATMEKGNVIIKIPGGLKATDFMVIAFEQNNKTLSIDRAAQTSIE